MFSNIQRDYGKYISLFPCISLASLKAVFFAKYNFLVDDDIYNYK